MFSSLGKKLKKTSEEGGNHSHTPKHPPPPPLVCPKVKKNAFVSLRPDEEICLIYVRQGKTGNEYDGVLKKPANVSNKIACCFSVGQTFLSISNKLAPPF